MDEGSRNIWRGRLRQLEKNRIAYERGKRPFVSWVSDLYSFRNHSGPRQELIGLKDEILLYAEELLDGEAEDTTGVADTADVIATVLVWMRGAVSRCYDTNRRYTDTAERIIELGLILVGGESERHTRLLLLLTRADLRYRYGTSAQRDQIDGILDVIALLAPAVSNVNQRNRVYRKLGMLERKRRFGHGWRHGLRAVFMRGVPLAVRAKSALALVS